MNDNFDVVVVGGGIVGLSAAIAMRQRHFSVALLDAGTLSLEANTNDARVYAVNHASQTLLEQLGVWQGLDKTRVSPYRHMYVWDASTGAHIEFDARLIKNDNLGRIIDEQTLKQALLQQASILGVVFFSDSKVSSIVTTPHHIQIGCENRSWHAQLLIAADGANSKTRQLLEIEVISWPYHQNALTTTVETELSHQETAYQVFNSDGPLAFLPLVNPNQCSIVWSTTEAQAQALINLPEEQFNQQLTQAFATKLGRCRIIGRRYQFPLFMRHAKQYTGPRWLLMGDAAHSIHPLAGLGLNVGLADLAAWIKALDAAQCHPWSKKLLGQYQRQRKSAVWQVIALMESLKTLFMNPLPPVGWIRGFGLKICNHFPLLKQYLIKHATGN